MTDSKTSPNPDEPAAAERASRYLNVGVPVGTVVLAGVAGAVQGPALAILVLAGGALIGVIAAFWSSVRTIFGETPLSGADAYALGAPRTEEEQKQAVLRALKDLEFERSVGKISEDDYKALVAKYREEAKRLLRLLDTEAAPRRAYVEALVAKRLKREGLLADDANEAESDDDDDDENEDSAPDSDDAPVVETSKPKAQPTKARAAHDRKEPVAPAKGSDRKKKPTPAQEKSTRKRAKVAAEPEPEAGSHRCASCRTVNDNDAAFCKKCGARLSPPSDSSDSNDASATSDEEAGAE